MPVELAQHSEPGEDEMVESEREMVRKLDDSELRDKFTSLQPTYEDTIPPDPEDWDVEQD
jgi:hypothetical protein